MVPAVTLTVSVTNEAFDEDALKERFAELASDQTGLDVDEDDVTIRVGTEGETLTSFSVTIEMPTDEEAEGLADELNALSVPELEEAIGVGESDVRSTDDAIPAAALAPALAGPYMYSPHVPRRLRARARRL